MRKHYLCTSASRTLLGEKISEFKNSKLFTIDFIQEEDSVTIHYELVHHIIEGNAIIHRWIDVMDDFQNKLVLKYNYHAKEISLENYKDLKNKWNTGFKDKLRKNFIAEGASQMIEETEKLLNNKVSFQSQFNGYTLFRCFFNPIFKGIIADQELNLKGYLGSADLNLITKTESLGNHVFKNTATIDEGNIAIKKVIRELTHSYTIKPTLAVDMEEIYELDKHNLPIKVDLYLDTNVISGFYNITNAHQVLEISKESFFEVAEKFENKQLIQSPFVIH